MFCIFPSMMSTTPSYYTYLLILVVVLLIIAVIVIVLIYNQKSVLVENINQQKLESETQQKLIQTTLLLQENERRRLSAALHESIGAMLSAIKLNFISVAKKEGIAAQNISPTNQMIDETIEMVRAMSSELMPRTLEKFGLSKAVKELADQYTKNAHVEILFSEEGKTHQLSNTYQIMIYRIVHELVDNALKHAEATNIGIHFNWGKTLVFSVIDNGKGFVPDQSMEKGLGLFTIGHRARLINATISYGKNHQNGSQIELRVPYL